MNLNTSLGCLLFFLLVCLAGFQPRASCTLGKHCFTELHLSPTARPPSPGYHAVEQCWQTQSAPVWNSLMMLYLSEVQISVFLCWLLLGGEMGTLFILSFQCLTGKSWWAICKLNLPILPQTHRLWLWNPGRMLKEFLFDLLTLAHRWKWLWLEDR